VAIDYPNLTYYYQLLARKEKAKAEAAALRILQRNCTGGQAHSKCVTRKVESKQDLAFVKIQNQIHQAPHSPQCGHLILNGSMALAD
jgi:hypothetical protein